jgi:hypothetical protein
MSFEAKFLASELALFSISKDDVYYAHMGINSAGAHQVSLHNCEQRNHDLGFGAPPACGDGHHTKPPNPDTPVTTCPNKSMALPIPINFNSNPNSTKLNPKIYELKSSQPLGPGDNNR